jgi:septal ring factor EnvC (AmiA/AmiB activator)
MSASRYILVLVLLLCGSLQCAVAQQKSKSQLQKERQQNLKKIKEVEKILGETSTKMKNTLGELSALNERISEQQRLISGIKNEVDFLEVEIGETNGFIRALQEDLAKLKEEYAAMLFAAQKASNSATRLTFLFSASSFEQMIMRMRYMRQYGEKRKLQANAILAVQKELGGQVKEIENKVAEKNSLLNEELAENQNLADLKKKQNALVKALTKEEKSLKQDLDQMKKALAALDKKINEIIKEEMERASREAKSKTGNSAAAIALSASFADNRAKFPWPVKGFVSMGFGRQKHPVLKGIYLENNGVNIQTAQDEKVKTIFEGHVSRVAFTPLVGNTVIIVHGDYFTVYSGLKEVYVKSGQKVTISQEIGQVQSNAEGISELRFQIRKNTVPLDPQQWLRN